MIKEEKNLVIKDLCGRLPYGVKVRYMSVGESMPQVWDLVGMPTSEHCDILVPNERRFSAVPIQDIKPYLRPLSSMTETEFISFKNNSESEYRESYEVRANNGSKIEIIQTDCDAWTKDETWLNAHHFDYRGLIEKGLVLQAPDGMYESLNSTTGNAKC